MESSICVDDDNGDKNDDGDENDDGDKNNDGDDDDDDNVLAYRTYLRDESSYSKVRYIKLTIIRLCTPSTREAVTRSPTSPNKLNKEADCMKPLLSVIPLAFFVFFFFYPASNNNGFNTVYVLCYVCGHFAKRARI